VYFLFVERAATMKWIVVAAASLLPISAALSVFDAAAAASIPTVPKVENADGDGFPVLPEVASLLKDVSLAVQGLRRETSTLQEELHNVEQRSHAKMNKQKAAYDQLLKKQEQTNQKIQGQNAERAKAMMKLRDEARKTQAEIKEEDEVNSKQRLKLKALQKQLEQARKATEDALGVAEDAKAIHAQADDDDTSTGSAADALVVEDEPARKSLSFLEIRRAAPASAKDAKASAAKPSSAMRKIVSGPRAHQKSVQVEEPSHAASSAAKASLAAPVQETNALHSNAEETASDEQQLIEVAGDAAETDNAHENLMPSADEQTQVLHDGASSSEGMVASLSQGVKRIQVEVQRSEGQLKLHFQKAYKAGKKRHAALIKQSEALDKNLHSMHLQENQLETTLAKDRATRKTLKQKIQTIGSFLNRAVSPLTSKQIA